MTNAMARDPDDSKSDLILQAATHAFSTYGYRKTSMNDIADGAGMSRPAVYLHYKNKSEIFRKLVQIYYDQADEKLVAIFGAGKPVIETLREAFDAQLGEMIETLLASPHGMELMDTGEVTATDLKEVGEARFLALYADWLRREAAAGRIQLPASPEQVASVILAALKSVKTAVTDVAGLRSRLTILSTLLGRGLQAT